MNTHLFVCAFRTYRPSAGLVAFGKLNDLSFKSFTHHNGSISSRHPRLLHFLHPALPPCVLRLPPLPCSYRSPPPRRSSSLCPFVSVPMPPSCPSVLSCRLIRNRWSRLGEVKLQINSKSARCSLLTELKLN